MDPNLGFEFLKCFKQAYGKFSLSGLSFKIVGLLFETHSRLGGNFAEKYYHRAIEQLLIKNNFKYRKELKVDIIFEKCNIGKYFLDFLVEDKILLEHKAVPKLLPVHFRQVKSCLGVKKIELGILANFRGESLIYKRILNRLSDKMSIN